MVSPEQGQKMPETATEAQAAAETTESSPDIPNIVNSNGIGNHDVENEICNGDKLEVSSEEVSPESPHQPGEVHTV